MVQMGWKDHIHTREFEKGSFEANFSSRSVPDFQLLEMNQ